ncbi:transcriptional regulator, DeoR family [Poseidonocella pacifica]|uniref:Transcriptional regulator, DeoR family n=1 Tax=Poseidonocella pacifica TaxID=871651 RepID=A0A1I0WSV8_9RHOB|nr:DeoR/GlpR family DNA-binding transcription regulator [Poseidonocella pacifica]SFA91624.1 transcriptional regulator, DeoR family [Poseidonocella pacifica]
MTKAGPTRAKTRGGLLSETRRRRILDWLEEEGSARVRDLAEAFTVSDVTIRQDLERLEAEGHITREYGGAYLNNVASQVASLSLQHSENMDKKRRIGALAASLVSDGETLILDAGSTTTEIATRLTDKRDLTVITNALNIAIILGAVPSVAVHLPGGQFKPPTLSVSGDKAVEYLSDVFAGKLFLATAGVSIDTGLTYPSFADLQLKQAMIAAANKTILVADSTKINLSSFTRLNTLEVVDTFITDDGIKDRDAQAFEALGIEVMIAV